MKTSLYSLITALVLFVGVPCAHAQFSLGVQGGYNLDAFTEQGAEEGTYFLGGQARLGLVGLPIILNPNADYFFNDLDDTNVLQFNADVLVPLGPKNAVFTPYAGLGLGVTRVSFDPDTPILGNLLESSETDFGVNLIGGATFGLGPVRPFAQACVTFGDHMAFLNEDGEGGPGYALMGGLLFHIGS